MNEFDIIRRRRRRGEGQKKEQPLDIKFEVTLVNLPILRPSNPRFPSSSRVAYAADCDFRGFCMIIFGQYTKIIGESIRKQKNHVANFYDGFPVFWAIF